MAKSLNPHAAAPSSSTPPAARSPEPTHSPEPPRRNVLVAGLAMIIGGILMIFPIGAGMLVFLDPVLKQRGKGANTGGKRTALRVSTLDALPEDGTPVQVPVIADLTDSWNREPNQPVGGVYLRRENDKVTCFNAICPHAGCFVAYSPERDAFRCPCHNSTFQLDGQRVMPSPSPRDMDTLDVDPEKLKQGEVWVEFVNFYPGKEHKEPKP